MQEESGQRRQGRRPRLVVSAGMLSQFYFKAFIALVLICVYFGAGLAFYMTTEHIHFTACIFFLTQTITTGNE